MPIMSFRRYVIKRAGAALLALYVALTINFLLFRVFSPVQDPTMLIMAPDFPEEEKQRLRVMWGLDRPYLEQYGVYLYNLLTWQYGLTFDTQPKPVAGELGWRLTNSLSLLATAMVFYTIIGIALGVFAASKRSSVIPDFPAMFPMRTKRGSTAQE